MGLGCCYDLEECLCCGVGCYSVLGYVFYVYGIVMYFCGGDGVFCGVDYIGCEECDGEFCGDQVEQFCCGVGFEGYVMVYFCCSESGIVLCMFGCFCGEVGEDGVCEVVYIYGGSVGECMIGWQYGDQLFVVQWV